MLVALVSATEMINKAKEGHYAIPAFNTNNLEWTQCILKAVQETNTPVIIQTSEGAAKYMGGYKMVVDMVNDLIDSMGNYRSGSSSS
jgi:fructose-bisphosphate aldolase (EC 4.1.2.13)